MNGPSGCKIVREEMQQGKILGSSNQNSGYITVQ